MSTPRAYISVTQVGSVLKHLKIAWDASKRRLLPGSPLPFQSMRLLLSSLCYSLQVTAGFVEAKATAYERGFNY